MEKWAPTLSDEQLDNAVKPIIQEYLEHGNTSEVEVIIVFEDHIFPCIFSKGWTSDGRSPSSPIFCC